MKKNPSDTQLIIHSLTPQNLIKNQLKINSKGKEKKAHERKTQQYMYSAKLSISMLLIFFSPSSFFFPSSFSLSHYEIWLAATSSSSSSSSQITKMTMKCSTLRNFRIPLIEIHLYLFCVLMKIHRH